MQIRWERTPLPGFMKCPSLWTLADWFSGTVCGCWTCWNDLCISLCICHWAKLSKKWPQHWNQNSFLSWGPSCFLWTRHKRKVTIQLRPLHSKPLYKSHYRKQGPLQCEARLCPREQIPRGFIPTIQRAAGKPQCCRSLTDKGNCWCWWNSNDSIAGV